ncbi:MAG: SDR family NAD(P)-dependent oxidoreductase [archaeon]|nr:SDR family NAD(P)-dependent oxidoreductase [Candidatus Bathyarchaeum sp.]
MKEFNGQEVVVTGGAGFIGSNLCKKLVELGAKVTVIDNLYAGSKDRIQDLIDEGLKFVEKDIRDKEAIEEVTKNCKTIFHLAAQTSVPFSMVNPQEDSQINVIGTLSVLEAAKKAGARVVFASSSAVYGNPKQKPTNETVEPNPIAFYGLTKLLGEHYCRFYHKTYGVEIVMFRIFNVYGPYCHGAIYDFLNKLKKDPTQLEVLGTGRQARDFIYVDDMVDALLRAAITPEASGHAFNVGTGTTTSVADLAEMIVKILGLENVNIHFKGGRAWEGDMDVTLADYAKAQKILKWTPQVSIEEGLKKIISSSSY